MITWPVSNLSSIDTSAMFSPFVALRRRSDTGQLWVLSIQSGRLNSSNARLEVCDGCCRSGDVDCKSRASFGG